jgi:hypothetical protein
MPPYFSLTFMKYSAISAKSFKSMPVSYGLQGAHDGLGGRLGRAEAEGRHRGVEDVDPRLHCRVVAHRGYAVGAMTV